MEFAGRLKPFEGVCRNCGKVGYVKNVREWFHKSCPRCFSCGGILDRVLTDEAIKEDQKQQKQKSG